MNKGENKKEGQRRTLFDKTFYMKTKRNIFIKELLSNC